MTKIGDKVALSRVPNGATIITPTGDIVSRVDDVMHYCASGLLLSPQPWEVLKIHDSIVSIVGLGMTGHESAGDLMALVTSFEARADE